MSVEIRSYEGTPNYIKGSPTIINKRDGVKKSHRGIVKAFRELGDQALNAADYERTMHLPVGRGRLACDPETGEFDPDAVRPMYNPANQAEYPRWVYSTITQDESQLADDKEEHTYLLSTKKWSDKPMERKKRFKLTPEDQLQDFKGQIESERARGNQLERKLEDMLVGANSEESKDKTSILELQLDEQRRETEILKARMEAVLSQLEANSRKEAEVEVVARGKK